MRIHKNDTLYLYTASIIFLFTVWEENEMKRNHLFSLVGISCLLLCTSLVSSATLTYMPSDEIEKSYVDAIGFVVGRITDVRHNVISGVDGDPHMVVSCGGVFVVFLASPLGCSSMGIGFGGVELWIEEGTFHGIVTPHFICGTYQTRIPGPI